MPTDDMDRFEPFAHGDYLRATGRGNAHIALEVRITNDGNGALYQMACGKTWGHFALHHVSEYEALQRPCHACWEAM